MTSNTLHMDLVDACVVGRHFADTSAWSLMVRVLAIFKILGPLGENGVEIPVEPKFLGGNAV